MNLEDLRSIQNAERTSGGLQPLRESFYEEVGQYIADLKAERDRTAHQADDPWSSPEVKRLNDEIDTAEEVVQAIYERRMGKILDRASLAAADMEADEEGLTAEERAMFGDLVERIRENKATVLDTVDPGSDAGADADLASTGERADPHAAGRDASDAAGGDAADATSRDASDAAGGDAPDVASRDAPDAGARADPDPGGRERVDPGPAPPDARPDPDPTADDGFSTADAMGDGTTSPTAHEQSGSDRTQSDSEGDGSPPESGRSPSESDRSSPGRDTGSPQGGARTDATDGPGGGTDDRVTVRITSDVGEILGIDDRQYDLRTEDVVELPAENADPLVERDAAQRLD